MSTLIQPSFQKKKKKVQNLPPLWVIVYRNKRKSGDCNNRGNTTEAHYTTPTIYQKNKMVFGGAHPRMTTLIQSKFSKKTNKTQTLYRLLLNSVFFFIFIFSLPFPPPLDPPPRIQDDCAQQGTFIFLSSFIFIFFLFFVLFFLSWYC